MFDPEDMILNNKKNNETEDTKMNEQEMSKEPEITEESETTTQKEIIEGSAVEDELTEEQQVEEEDMETDGCSCGKAPNGEGPSLREYRYEEQVKKTPRKRRNWAKFIAACLIVSVAGGAAEYFGSFSVPYEANGMGSGVIFYSDDDKVAIATNNHVVNGANSIFVTFEGDASVPAKVVGTKSESDLAVITVSWEALKSAGVKNVSVASFGDSDHLEVGDSVIAIGNAMGMGLSATDGMVSMTEQTINVEGNQLNVLQTSAAINGGNSGGPLVNSAGEVVGINTAKYNSSMAEGMGYAIPSNVIKPIVEDLLENGTQPRPYIGIKGTSITSENADLYKLPVGALIMEVAEGGPAEKAGIMVGDIITSFNGNTVMDMDSLVKIVGETKVGDTVDVHVVRDGKTGHDLKMTIADKNS